MSENAEFLSMQEAADYLKVSRYTIWRLIKEHNLTVYQSPVSKRVRLLRQTDLDALREPRPVQDDQQKAV